MLAAAEKKILVKIADRLPAWVTSDQLTWLGVIGALICAVGYGLANINIQWLWLSSGGLVINWFGDSLDGTLARVRNTQRPTYGFYIDHALDAFTICLMCIGAGISPMFPLSVALLVLAGYLVISIHTYLLTILKDEFKISYAGLGPTEFRLIIIVFNVVATYVPWQKCNLYVCGYEYGIFELIGIALIIIIWSINIVSFFTDLRYFAKKDPAKPYKPER